MERDARLSWYRSRADFRSENGVVLPSNIQSLSVAIVGVGRAGGSVALAASKAGHAVLLSPGPSGQVSPALDHLERMNADDFAADLVIVATPDDVIHDAAQQVGARVRGTPVMCHLSGFTSIHAVDNGTGRFGSVHPLMTMADAVAGARALVGSPVAVTASDPATREVLWGFATSLGMAPFSLDDSSRQVYHAGAAVASNVTTGVLGLAFELFRSAGVDPGELRPLVERSVANAFDLGPDRALTGPVVRGDSTTVAGHRAAVHETDPALGEQLDLLIEFLSRRVRGV